MITEAQYKGDYKILVCFDDGTMHLADFRGFISQSALPCVRKYLDLDLFRQFSVNEWGLCWGENEFDINPLSIHNGDFDVSE